MLFEYLVNGSDDIITIIVTESGNDDGVVSLLEKGWLRATWSRHPTPKENDGHGEARKKRAVWTATARTIFC